jgi:adenosylcobinamide amidohydrolase
MSANLLTLQIPFGLALLWAYGKIDDTGLFNWSVDEDWKDDRPRDCLFVASLNNRAGLKELVQTMRKENIERMVCRTSSFTVALGLAVRGFTVASWDQSGEARYYGRLGGKRRNQLSNG